MKKDIEDLQQFCCKFGLDFVAASFVQSREDVLFIRRILDEAGGQSVRIISKIENQEGLRNYDEILEVTDGIMVARGDLGMEIPVEKVCLCPCRGKPFRPLLRSVRAGSGHVLGSLSECQLNVLECSFEAVCTRGPRRSLNELPQCQRS